MKTLQKKNIQNLDFIDQVESICNENISLCWHCLSCSGGCPFSQDMDYHPNTIVRMVQFGMKEEVLQSSTIWLCVGCNTCSTVCPNSIDMASIMDALRQIAILEGVKISEPRILSFHNAVIDSISRYGRTHKLEIMMRYKLAEKDFFSDMNLGLKTFPKRKLDLLPSKVKDKQAINSLFEMAGA